jgi:hypothetical protein
MSSWNSLAAAVSIDLGIAFMKNSQRLDVNRG